MARARNVKPGFFMNDELAEIEPLGRLLFIGLWTIADREGRLENRPTRIKAETLPYDDCNIDKLLDDLAQHNFIIRYEVNGVKYIQITNFTKHQNPHKNEKPSEIPAIPNIEKLHEHSGTNQEKAVSTRVIDGTTRADSFNMIPDSFNMIPDSNIIVDTPSESDVNIEPEPKKEVVPTSKFDDNSQPYKMALYLRNAILKNDPNTKVPNDDPKSLEKWAIEADRLVRLDKRAPTEIKELMDWATKDPFWCANILSMKKFREKYDTLKRQYQNKASPKRRETEIERQLREEGILP